MGNTTMASDFKTEVELWQFLRMRSENITKYTIKVHISAIISRLYRFSTPGNPMVASDFQTEVELWHFLRMRSENVTKSTIKVHTSAIVSRLYNFTDPGESNFGVRFVNGSRIIAASAHAQ